MTDDLKKLAEAAKAATAAYIADPTDRETGRQWDRACAEFSLACTEDAILNLIRERDEAREKLQETAMDYLAVQGQAIMAHDRAVAAETALSKATEERDAARSQGERLAKLDQEAAAYVETVICLRTGFTGDPPYVGWKGLGLALTEALDKRDAAEAALSAAREEVERLRAGIAQIATHIANAGRGKETTNERILDRVDEVLTTLTPTASEPAREAESEESRNG